MEINMINIDVAHHLTPVVIKSFKLNGQAYAQTIPYLLESHFPDLSVLHLDKGRMVLQDSSGKRYKVVCSKNNTYDIYPSYTKGVSRTKDGVDIKSYISSLADTLILVDIKNVTSLNLVFKDTVTLPKDFSGKITLE